MARLKLPSYTFSQELNHTIKRNSQPVYELYRYVLLNKVYFHYNGNIESSNTYYNDWAAQEFINSYIWDNYKTVLALPSTQSVYYLNAAFVSSAEVNGYSLIITFTTGDILTIDYDNIVIATYHQKYVNRTLNELRFAADDDTIHVVEGQSIRTAIESNTAGNKIYVHSGSYTENRIDCSYSMDIYCEENVNIFWQLNTKISSTIELNIYGFADITWQGSSGMIDGGRGKVFLSCRSIHIDSPVENSPVAFSSIDNGESYELAIKGQSVYFRNLEYTFIDFDANSEIRFLVDIDFATIDLHLSSLEYGFYQISCLNYGNTTIWRNAFITNYNDSDLVIFDYSSSFFKSYHIHVGLKILQKRNNGYVFNYDNDSRNLFDLELCQCWIQSSNIFFMDTSRTTNKIVLHGHNYSNALFNSSRFLTIQNFNKLIVDSLINLN